MKMIGITLGTVIAVIITVAWCNSGHAQPYSHTGRAESFSNFNSSSNSQSGVKSQSEAGSRTERCIKDAFGNYTCTESGTRIITDSQGNITIIPMRR